jgi:hypothetical protein
MWMLWFIHYMFRSQMDHLQVILIHILYAIFTVVIGKLPWIHVSAYQLYA